MKIARMVCAVAWGLLLAAASAQENRTPAEWVARLGADHLAERDEASAALLNLGSKARADVHSALDSPDPEVQARARDLWKKLRWLVVPGADDDTRKLVDEWQGGSIDPAHWNDFVQKHGAASIRLVAALHAGNAASTSPATGPVIMNGFMRQGFIGQFGGRLIIRGGPPPAAAAAPDPAGLNAVLELAAPVDVARVITDTESPSERLALQTMIDGVSPINVTLKIAVNWMKIQIALWNYEKAYNFGSEAAIRLGGDELMAQCAAAVERGKLFDPVEQNARQDITAETDPKALCGKLGYYVVLMSLLGKKDRAEALCDLVAQNIDMAQAGDEQLRRLVGGFMGAKMPERAIKALRQAQSPMALYMRSAADLEAHNIPASTADWQDALAALDAVKPEQQKQVLFSLGELMRDWHDPRAGMMWQKILAIAPATSVYDANACFRMAEIFEEQLQYSQAADLYEKGMAIAGTTGGVFLVTGPGTNGANGTDGADVIREKIKKLRSLPGGNNPAPSPSPATTPESTPSPEPVPAPPAN